MLARLILAYILVPLVPPVVMITWSGAWRMPFADWLGILLLYEVIGFIAMIALGTPILLVYKRFGWTGWGAFMLGGGFCAAVTSSVFLFSSHQLSQVPFVTVLGILAGLVFRFLLYGAHKISPADSPVP